MMKILGTMCAVATSAVLSGPTLGQSSQPGIGPIEGATFQELLWHDAFGIQFKEKRDFLVLAPGSLGDDFDVYPCRTVNTTDGGGGFSGDYRGELLSVHEMPTEWIEDVSGPMTFNISGIGPVDVHVAVSVSAFSGELVSDSGYEAFISGIISRTTLTVLGGGSGSVEMIVAYPLARHLSMGEADEVAIDFSLLDPIIPATLVAGPCADALAIESQSNGNQLFSDLSHCESGYKRLDRVQSGAESGAVVGGVVGGGAGLILGGAAAGPGAIIGSVLGAVGGGIGGAIFGEGKCKSEAKKRYRDRYWDNWTCYLLCEATGNWCG